jgi:prepilin-type N-terminal cleavage/methylation domain-containing protein
MKHNKTKKGFTIVELVIVIGVIGILAGILIPTFVNVTQKAEEAALKSNLANAYSAYVADAADGSVETAKYIVKGGEQVTTYQDPTTKEPLYSIELIKQEETVLIGAAGNKDAGTKYKFNGTEWAKLDDSVVYDADNYRIVVDNKAATPAYYSVAYGSYLVYNFVPRG